MTLPQNVADAYILRLKAYFQVGSDDDLAKKIGAAKSTIASWRRRGIIPETVYGPLFQRERIDFFAVINDYFAERLASMAAGETVLMLMAMRMADYLDDDGKLGWSRWIAQHRLDLIKRLVAKADLRTLSEESLSESVADILVAVRSNSYYGPGFLKEVRDALEA